MGWSIRKIGRPYKGIWKSNCEAPLCALRKAYILKYGKYNNEHVKKVYNWLKKKNINYLTFKVNYERY